MPSTSHFTQKLLDYSQSLGSTCTHILSNSDITEYVIYNVFEYAWDGWSTYITNYANHLAKTLILGINPGPHGMVQTGVPFGNISTITHWLNINPKILQPAKLHPKRPVLGLKYHKEEASGYLLWNTIANLFPTPASFFKQCIVLNYCPLAFFTEDGGNVTPDKIPPKSRESIEEACSLHLASYLKAFGITRILGIGRYATKKASQLCTRLHTLANRSGNDGDFQYYSNIEIHYISHPSPLNPNHKQFPDMFSSFFN